MEIKKIQIKNFKNFKDTTVNLNKFNAIVGECASGKSNFIEALKFLNEISEDFEKTILKHGTSLMQNVKIKNNQPTSFKILINYNKPLHNKKTEISKNFKSNIYYTDVEYELCFNFKGNKCNIISENIKFDFSVYENEFLNSKLYTKNSLIYKNNGKEVKAKFKNNDEYCDLEYFAPQTILQIINNNIKQKPQLLINSPLNVIPIPWIEIFKSISIYDFNPKFSKNIYNNGDINLKEDGGNLSFILDDILNDNEKKEHFLLVLSNLLPYIENIDVEHIRDNQRIFLLFEKYADTPIFAPFVSDGTANILALICALYFSNNDVLIFEEPERNIHPGLFIDLISMMKELNKQVIISTHSPEILDYCKLNDILLISRTKEGFSKITEPKNNNDVVEFVKDLGIGQVFLNNYLGFKNE